MASRRIKRKRGFWTPEKEALAYRLKAEGVTLEEICGAVGMSKCACQRLLIAAPSPSKKGRPEKGAHIHHFERGVTVSNKQLIDRQKREEAAATRNLTAALFGDPPPGYSALDRRRSA